MREQALNFKHEILNEEKMLDAAGAGTVDGIEESGLLFSSSLEIQARNIKHENLNEEKMLDPAGAGKSDAIVEVGLLFSSSSVSNFEFTI